MRPMRVQALATLLVFVTSLIVPVIIEAGDYEVPLSDDSASYISDVTGRLTTKDALEQQWQRTNQHRQQLQDQLDAIEAAQRKGGRSDDWYERATRRVRQIKEELTQTGSVLDRSRERLGKIYQQLDGDRRRISSSNDPALKQELGTMIGVAGASIAAPIWTRPTLGQVGGSIGQAGRVVRLSTVNARIPVYNNVAAGAGTRAANASTALGNIKPGRWVPQGNGANGAGQIQLRRHAILPDGSTGGYQAGQRTVNTRIPAKYQAADGTWHQNTRGMQSAADMASLHNTRSAIQNNINKLRLEASRATNTKVKTVLENRAQALEVKKGQLETNINQYRTQNPSLGQQAKVLAGNAAKWAAFSVALTVGTNTIMQLSRNGWDPSKINWKDATAQLRDKRFWGGVGGSFIGSYGGSLIASALPGGAFVKALFAIGGAAVGWQAGSGNLGNTDWVQLGATTVGATVGILIGTALGGPIGAFIGGIVGHLAADFILKKVRQLIINEVPAEGYGGPGDRTGYSSGDDPYGGYGGYSSDRGTGDDVAGGGYQGQSPGDTGYQGGDDSYGGSSDSAGDLASRRAEVYQEMIALQSEIKSNPQAFQEFLLKQREYDQLTRELHQMQRGGNIRDGR